MLIDFTLSEIATIKIAMRRISDEMKLSYDPFESIILKCAKAEAENADNILADMIKSD